MSCPTKAKEHCELKKTKQCKQSSKISNNNDDDEMFLWYGWPTKNV